MGVTTSVKTPIVESYPPTPVSNLKVTKLASLTETTKTVKNSNNKNFSVTIEKRKRKKLKMAKIDKTIFDPKLNGIVSPQKASIIISFYERNLKLLIPNDLIKLISNYTKESVNITPYLSLVSDSGSYGGIWSPKSLLEYNNHYYASSPNGKHNQWCIFESKIHFYEIITIKTRNWYNRHATKILVIQTSDNINGPWIEYNPNAITLSQGIQHSNRRKVREEVWESNNIKCSTNTDLLKHKYIKVSFKDNYGYKGGTNCAYAMYQIELYGFLL